jgi:pSer/pThr/pTyr-binding forkhead associated (FHA) protein
MFGQLVPNGGGTSIPLRRRRIVIGRAAECDVVLSDPTVSGKHCLLEIRDGAWFVFDLASRNGIRINGTRCHEGRLDAGNEFSISSCTFRVELFVAAEEATMRDAEETRINQSDSRTTGLPVKLSNDKNGRNSCEPLNAALVFGELVPCDGGQTIPLRKTEVLIGRSPDCDLVLPMPVVSGKHCRLEFYDGYWHVRDLGSRNGIRVDGMKRSADFLKPGAILTIGEQRFQLAYEPPVSMEPVDVVMPLAVPTELPLQDRADGDAHDAGTAGSTSDTKKRWVQAV